MSGCNIIGCGPTGSLWDGLGFSIGVNDCMKFGRPVNALVCVNVFSKEPLRQKIVNETKTTHGFWSHSKQWQHRGDFKKLDMQQWAGRYIQGRVYWSHTSTFIAITLAVKLGYTEIVLYGCDLTDHKHVKNKILADEIKNTLELSRELEKIGVKLYIYKAYGAFKDHLPSITE
jgi:hypothetical protein